MATETSPVAAEPESPESVLVDLSRFDNSDYDPGRGTFVRTAWYFCSLLVFESGWFPLSGPKRTILRLFGAEIGVGVVIKPHVRIKYPWRLRVGDHCWIGQNAWLDNLADITIGNHVCISQLAYLCTGSHDHRRPTFDLIIGPITVHDGAWVGARATVLQNVTIGAGAIVAAGSVVYRDVAPQTILAGNPPKKIGQRTPE